MLRSAAGDGKAQMKRRAFADLRVEGERPAVFVDDDRSSDGETLTRAAPHFFGREKRVENEALNLCRNSTAGVADGDMDEVVFELRTHLDEPLLLGPRHDIADGMRGID